MGTIEILLYVQEQASVVHFQRKGSLPDPTEVLLYSHKSHNHQVSQSHMGTRMG